MNEVASLLPSQLPEGPSGVPARAEQPVVAVRTQPSGFSSQPEPGLKALPSRQASGLMCALHAAIRGRYVALICTSLLVGAAGGAIGWRLAWPRYHSEGLVRIAYTLPKVREETDQNGPLPMFETFMLSQKMLITSRRVIDLAIQDSVWKATGRQVPPKPDQYFAEHLNVETSPRSEYIRITVKDSDPGTAAVAVTAVINAYSELYATLNKQMDRQRLGVLEDQRAVLQGRLDQLSAQLGGQAKEYGTLNLDTFYEAAAARLTKLEAAVADVRVAMVTATTQPLAGGAVPTTRPDVPRTDLTVEQIAQSDPAMQGYLDRQGRMEDELSRLVLRCGEAHPAVVSLRWEMEILKSRIRKHADMYRQFHLATAQNPNDARMGASGISWETLKTNEENLVRLREQTKQEMVALGNKRLDLQRIQLDLEAVRTQLTQLDRRMEVLRGEGALGGRLTVVSTGEIPLSPDLDPRQRVAAAAAVGGLGLPVATVFLVSLLRRRYRYSDDTEAHLAQSEVPLLGLLPELRGSPEDEDSMRAAAHAVHQLRVSLSTSHDRKAPRSYLVTSATAGEGKTSLSMALAMSFATAHQRTLVVDCDLVGRRVTSGFGAKGAKGLCEALNGDSLVGLLQKVSSNLYVLPAGGAGPADACGIATAPMRSLLRRARDYFHVVVIDTGPILGSVEAAVVAPEVDGVLLTLSRGQQPRFAEQAMRRLRVLGACMSGVVFNRAKRQDFAQSPYGSASIVSTVAPGSRTESADQPRVGNFGPLVRAMVVTSPADWN